MGSYMSEQNFDILGTNPYLSEIHNYARASLSILLQFSSALCNFLQKKIVLPYSHHPFTVLFFPSSTNFSGSSLYIGSPISTKFLKFSLLICPSYT